MEDALRLFRSHMKYRKGGLVYVPEWVAGRMLVALMKFEDIKAPS